MNRVVIKWVLLFAFLAIALYLMLHYWIANWMWHPLGACTGANCKGYQWWSGLASDLGEVTLLVAFAGWARHHNCSTKGCWRLGHAHPGHGRPVCGPHYHHTPHILKVHHPHLHDLWTVAEGQLEVVHREAREQVHGRK